MDEQKKELEHKAKAKRKCKRTFDCLWSKVNVPLIPLKIVNFCWHGAYASLIPYLSVYMKNLGLNVRETGFIFTVLPLSEVIAPVVGGAIADKTGKYKAVYMTSLLMCAIFCACFHFIPHISNQCDHKSVEIRCSSSSYAASFSKNCSIESQDHLELEVDQCKFICLEVTSIEDYNFESCRDEDSCPPILTEKTKESFSLVGNVDSRCSLNITSIKTLNRTYTNPSCSWKKESENFQCIMKCLVTKINNTSVPCEPVRQFRYLTVGLCLTLNVGLSFFTALCFSMLDATIFVLVTKHDSYFGRQRLWASMGQAIFSPLTGYIVDHFSQDTEYIDYSIAFHIFTIMIVFEALAMYSLNVTAPARPKNFFKNLRMLLSSPKISVFFVAVFVLGTCWGFLESFLFWFLSDLNSPNYLLGLTLTVASVCSAPFLYKSEWFVGKLGHVNLMIIAFFFYLIRYFGYSFITNPWWSLLFEAMEASTYHLLWVTVATYSGILAPEGLLATVEGCVGGLHFGIGRGAGSLLGGMLIDDVGIRTSFRIVGSMSGLVGLMYAIFYYFTVRKERLKKMEKRSSINANVDNQLQNLKRDSISNKSVDKEPINIVQNNIYSV